MIMKCCTKCRVAQEVSCYYKQHNRLRSICKLCVKEHNKIYYKQNREAVRSNTSAYYIQNLEKSLATRKLYRDSNKDKNAEDHRAWSKKNPGSIRAIQARRRAAKLKRTPLWSERAEIKEFYQNCPVGHHVDHIVPLQGETVSGLHVLSNLQYLTAKENISKGNKFRE